MHSLIIRAQNSEVTKVLQKLLDQWNDFLKTLDAFNDKEEADFIECFLIERKLLEPFNANLIILNLPSEYVQILFTIDHPTTKVFYHLTTRLAQLGRCKLFLYQFRNHQEPQIVLVWNKDLKKLSKRLKDKLVALKV